MFELCDLCRMIIKLFFLLFICLYNKVFGGVLLERRISLEDALKRTKDLFELAGIKEEVVSNEIMKQVKEILSIGQIDDNVVGDSFVINNNKTFVEMYMDLIDSMRSKHLTEDTEMFTPSKNDTVEDIGNVDYTDHISNYDDYYFNGEYSFDLNSTSKKEQIKETFRKSVRMNFAFPELIEDLVFKEYG